MRSIIIAALFNLCTPALVTAESTRPYFIDVYARRFKVDPDLLISICSVESLCRTKAINHNDGTREQKRKGIKSRSYGMFQIKMATAKALGFNPKRESLLNPKSNTYYAAKLLRSLYNRYGNTIKVVSAYNAGSYTKKNAKYVDRVLRQYAILKIDKRNRK